MSQQFVTSYLSSLGGVTNAKSNVVVSSDSFSVTSMAFSEVSKSFIVPLKNASSPVVPKQPPPTIWSSDLILGWDLQWREIASARTPDAMPRYVETRTAFGAAGVG